MTVWISSDPSNPERFRCDNFEVCGVSSSHDPEFVGWEPHNRLWFHDRDCWVKYLFRQESA